MLRLLPVVAIFFSHASVRAETPAEIFEKRLMPIFKSDKPSSCFQCHLAGVDLKDYILPDSRKTFLALRDQGLIDLLKPECSTILKLIQMGQKQTGQSNSLNAKTRQAEFEAFQAWIEASCRDADLVKAPKRIEADRAGPKRPIDVVRHARKDAVLDSFEKNVWAWRFRCMNCNTEGSPQNDKNVKEFGERVAWVKKSGAEATMDYLLTSNVIDLKNPSESVLLLKPLGKIKHKGGIKFIVGDQGYQGFRKWIEDVAAIKADRYAAVADLPAKETLQRFGTEIWFKLEKTPKEWGNKLLQVQIFAKDPKTNDWEVSPIATSDRLVAENGNLWQHTLTLLAAADSDRAKEWRRSKAQLPNGAYSVKVFVDRGKKRNEDWKAVLGQAEFVGQSEFQGRWHEGYGGMTIVDASKIKP